ncbi:MAG: GNAT family N-acetyltransferase [Desulfopila sp.]
MNMIVPATLADLDDLVGLENEVFASDRIPRRQFRYLLTKAHSIVVKIDDADQLAGYLILLLRRNSRRLRIYSIGISAGARNRGYGRRLVQFAEDVARLRGLTRLTLEVCEHNVAALSLYRRTGFLAYGIRPDYYQDGCTALLLAKEII